MNKLLENYNGIVYQVIRPTGLLDPIVEVRPSLPETFERLKLELKSKGLGDMPLFNASSWSNPQVPDLIEEIQKITAKKQRVLVTTLTKRMSEELSEYLTEKGINARYLHSDLDSMERVKLLKELRLGYYDVLVGINLLREGLDLPEVSLVAILDADKEGFLRSRTSLVQVIGRAARHQEGRVIMYADKITDSMLYAITETRKRRAIQHEHNLKNNITPASIIKAISDQLQGFVDDPESENSKSSDLQDIVKKAESYKALSKSEQKKLTKELKFQMELYADMLEFEKAAEIRDVLNSIS